MSMIAEIRQTLKLDEFQESFAWVFIQMRKVEERL